MPLSWLSRCLDRFLSRYRSLVVLTSSSCSVESERDSVDQVQSYVGASSTTTSSRVDLFGRGANGGCLVLSEIVHRSRDYILI